MREWVRSASRMGVNAVAVRARVTCAVRPGVVTVLRCGNRRSNPSSNILSVDKCASVDLIPGAHRIIIGNLRDCAGSLVVGSL